ncbi:leucyl/phenylalanyl-tRNA--protein transferase [Pleionea sp. CnH1-48]|uniref:leucyl/phenylalanyl-tRNA--protein transferase n=1 Tax=Pleionea sp. CnH1-48 TaxID=2954494 RepID=UPI0020974AC4|nr:leucyl/phenylalanyl-tRNA--protein transferase [Pleionea sp. CnH1-48]MCO7222762.1 leucyl/phenylalanyl-tRNA--protein transferase [Pleionea sp. CnH1-48]
MLSLPLIESPEHFPPVETALDDPDGLLAYGFTLSIELLLGAYYRGIFPWYSDGDPVLWWSPNPRAAFFTEQFSPSKSLRKQLRKADFKVSINQNFAAVIKGCSDPRKDQSGTWITEEMQLAYIDLHRAGYAHSVEVWQQEQLVGGLYGVSLGRLFFGESMFHTATDASKVALCYLVSICRSAGFPMIDCQLPNPHLSSLGAETVSRNEFLDYLYQWRDQSVPADMWQPRWLPTHRW